MNEWMVRWVGGRKLFFYAFIVKDRSDSERVNPLPRLHGLLVSISSKGFLILSHSHRRYHIPQPLLIQSWCNDWNEKKLNESTTRDRSSDPLHHG